MIKLKPCPFCGSKPKKFRDAWHTNIECVAKFKLSDPVHRAWIYAVSEEEAVKLWNARI